MAGFLKLQRSQETIELLQDHPVFCLLTLIAIRARRTGEFNRHELGPGESLIGDHDACGMTRQQYRTAKNKLEKWGFVAFRTTNKGTIAKLLNSAIYDINEDGCNQPNNQQTTSKQPASNQQATSKQPLTRKKEVKEVKEVKEKTFLSDSVEVGLSELLLSKILKRTPDLKKPNIQTWAKHIDLMLRLEKREPSQIKAVIEWCQSDPFWQNNILSTEKLRKHFDQLALKAKAKHEGPEQGPPPGACYSDVERTRQKMEEFERSRGK